MKKSYFLLTKLLPGLACLALVACGSADKTAASTKTAGAEKAVRQARALGGKMIPYSDLLDRLTDPGALARLDATASKLVSSYDRRGGNNDFNNPLRDDGDGWVVMADLEGPGYISRFWFTGSDDGTYPLRFYFDDESTPSLDTTVGAFCGGEEPFREPLAAYDAFCWYSFVPVPYQQHLVVKTRKGGTKPDGSPKIFFQVNYNDLPDGSTIESFPKQLTPEVKTRLASIRSALDKPRGIAIPGTAETLHEGAIPPGSAASGKTLQGPAIIRELRIGVDLAAAPSFAARQQAMRETHLRIYWDDAKEPSVEAPLGDFFGTPWQRRQFESMYFGLTGDVFFTRFPMPFQKSARVEIVNGNAYPLPVTISATREPLPAWNPSLGYFHAAWRKTTPAQVGQPHTFLEAEGRGQYVGCLLTTLSMDQSWWMLEGDETMHVDGEAAPSWHGTGLEDYFNGGWYYGSALIRPYNGLPFKAQFRTVQYRIHHTDPVAFSKSMRVQIERGPDQASKGFLESVAFYYLATPARANSVMGDANFRIPPQDKLYAHTVMTEINEFERLGDTRGAKEYIQAFLEVAPANYPYLDILRLRLLAYEAEERGYAAIAERMPPFLGNANPLVKRDAEDLKWFHEDPAHALLGTYCNTQVQLYMDGKALGILPGDPERFEFRRITLTPGRHAIGLKTRERPYPFWVLADLKTHTGHIGTQSDWKQAFPANMDWAAADFDDTAWKPIGGARLGKGPPEEPYIFLEPHAHIGMQAQTRGIWTSIPWTDKTSWAVFRKSFDVPTR